jgi:hypothetical protein
MNNKIEDNSKNSSIFEVPRSTVEDSVSEVYRIHLNEEAPAKAKKKVVKIKPKAAPLSAPAAAPAHSNDLFPNLFNDE